MPKYLLIILFVVSSSLFAQDLLKERSALNLAREGNFDGAIEIYENLIKDSGESPERFYNLGTIYLQKGDFGRSIDLLTMAAASDNSEIKEKALYNLGNAYFKKEEFPQAIDAFKKVLKINSDNRDARENLELSIRGKNKQEQEQKDSQQNEKMEPSEFAKKIKKQAEQLAQQRNYKDAYNLMMAGLQKDKTVQVFREFISRLNTIIEIDG